MKSFQTLLQVSALVAVAQAKVFPITKASDGLNCRSGPTVSDSIVKSYPGTASVDITCQTNGDAVNGYTVWDKTTDNCFVSDWYVYTGTDGFVVEACGGGGGGGSTTPPPPSTPPPAGAPSIPSHNCRQYVIDSGHTLLAEFPGAIHTVWCYADKPGEHGEGRALDFMVQPHAAVGREMAEWAMRNAKRLNIWYVIWEQRIWNTQNNEPEMPWDQWSIMEDRGDCTANHCDHVHISYLNL